MPAAGPEPYHVVTQAINSDVSVLQEVLYLPQDFFWVGLAHLQDFDLEDTVALYLQELIYVGQLACKIPPSEDPLTGCHLGCNPKDCPALLARARDFTALAKHSSTCITKQLVAGNFQVGGVLYIALERAIEHMVKVEQLSPESLLDVFQTASTSTRNLPLTWAAHRMAGLSAVCIEGRVSWLKKGHHVGTSGLVQTRRGYCNLLA
ncbi:hypothetical protein B0H17DRAFT_1189139 [Mycena rosella]|uniref:Uncharacterized protein n=1 Tax=Mycena rosella TaxID=1033263 RepID=A0AAD7B7D6_MYCRO|nr:hypothetical protein B0H17DRAFT_1189139 [Mycena rosella]